MLSMPAIGKEFVRLLLCQSEFRHFYRQEMVSVFQSD